MNVRKITPEEIPLVHFAHEDVLNSDEQKSQRTWKLNKAVMLTNVEHQDIGLIMQLADGEVIETYSNMVEFADNFVQVRGGWLIPVWAIVDVEA